MGNLLEKARALAARGGETVPGKVVRKFGEDMGANQAILIAWTGLTSIFPIALALAGILGLVLSHLGINQSARAYEAILSVIPGDAGDTMKALDHLQHQTGVFFVIGLAGMLWTGSSLFGTMEQAFDLIFHVERRTFLRQKLMALGMIFIFTVLAGFAIAASTLLPLLDALPFLPRELRAGATFYVVEPLVGTLAGVVLFGTIYYVVPNRRQRVREVWPGALFAGTGFYALTLLFPIYIALNRAIDQYGKAFAFLLVVMTFFYFVGLLTMLGVELNAVLYPVPVEQPDKAERLAPSQSEQPGEREVRPGRGRRAPAGGGGGGRDDEPRGGGRQRQVRGGGRSPEPAGGRGMRSRPRRLVFGALAVLLGTFAAARHRPAA